ncbi:uncharacterized protein CBL_21012, partial [Carabus blaptoides fortunei]
MENDSDFDSDSDIEIEDSQSDSSDEGSSTSSSEEEEEEFMDARQFWKLDIKNLNPAPKRFTFSEIPAVHFQVEDNSAIEIFENFFYDKLIDLIVLETNKYADQSKNVSNKKHSRILKWTPTDRNELRIFFALLILQGIIQKPDIEMYWSKKHIIDTPFFPEIMPYRRFALIKRFLHFSDNNSYDPDTHPNPKLNKIWPVYTYLNKVFASSVTLERDIAIDESLMLYKGRLGWKQYIPSKRARYGIKSFMLCESKSGYIWSSIVYTGKGTTFDEEYRNLPMSSQIVMTLMKPLLGKGYCLTTDNFYTSPGLADFLIQHKTDTYGTMRINRKDIPAEFKTEKLKKGDIVAFQTGKLCIMRWKDKKDVCLLSTIHRPDFTDIIKRNKTIRKPKVICEYKNTMGGVDRADQHLTNYPVIKNRGKKYYLKMFMHLMDQAVWNSFVVYKKYNGSKTHLQFRMDLNVIECKKTNAVTWKDKEEAWNKISEKFSSAMPNMIPRSKESINKFYDKKKKEIRKMSAFQRAEHIKTGGGVPAVLTNDPTNNILLQIVNEKTIIGLSNTFDGDNNSIENVAEETNIIQ